MPTNQREKIQHSILIAACSVARGYNEQTLKMRRNLKSFYKEQQSLGLIEERSRLNNLTRHQDLLDIKTSQCNFLHCLLTPNQAFINAINNQNYRKDSGRMESTRLVLIDNEETSMPKRQEQLYRPVRRDADPVQVSLNDGTGFRCITCNRGPPYTKKYAKN